MPFVIVKIDETGKITDPDVLTGLVQEPFAFTDVFLSAHGWWTTPDRAVQEYNAFHGGLSECLAKYRSATGLVIPPDDQILAIGLQWPSMVSATLGPFRTIFEAFSYDEMRTRAELIANSSVMSLIRRLWSFARDGRRLTLHALGHSMGCRLVCQAFCSALYVDSQPTNPNDLGSAPLAKVLPNLRINVALLEGAIDNNTIDCLQKYGLLASIDGVRVMVTHSDLDAVLQCYPPDVSNNPAMGAKGPSAGTFTDSDSKFFNQQGAVDVGATFAASGVADVADRFIVADLTKLHAADKAKFPGTWGGLSGSHSDVFEPAIYELVTGFLFGRHGETPSA